MNYRPVTDVGFFARRKHDYYGGFFAGSLERMRLALGAQITDPILFVCAGRVRWYPMYGMGPNDKTLDIRKLVRPDYLMDARHGLPQCPFDPQGWRAMIVDAPWSKEEAKNYGTEKQYPEPGPLLKLCLQHTRPGGRVGFLHWLYPSPPPKVDGCEIKPVFGMPMALFNETWRGYVVYEKRLPDTWSKRRRKRKVKP